MPGRVWVRHPRRQRRDASRVLGRQIAREQVRIDLRDHKVTEFRDRRVHQRREVGTHVGRRVDVCQRLRRIVPGDRLD
jgi:hypothetical protein